VEACRISYLFFFSAGGGRQDRFIHLVRFRSWWLRFRVESNLTFRFLLLVLDALLLVRFDLLLAILAGFLLALFEEFAAVFDGVFAVFESALVGFQDAGVFFLGEFAGVFVYVWGGVEGRRFGGDGWNWWERDICGSEGGDIKELSVGERVGRLPGGSGGGFSGIDGVKCVSSSRMCDGSESSTGIGSMAFISPISEEAPSRSSRPCWLSCRDSSGSWSGCGSICPSRCSSTEMRGLLDADRVLEFVRAGWADRLISCISISAGLGELALWSRCSVSGTFKAFTLPVLAV
jgi:hypothetical protein